MRNVSLVLLALGLFLVSGSHIDDVNGELSNFVFDEVRFRLQKDCALDRIPDVSCTCITFKIKYFLEEDSIKYPKLNTFLSGIS